MQCVRKCLPSLRADGSRRGNPVEVATRLTGSPRASALAMTLAESVLQLDPIKNAAFTMAEILLSLTIIGVVAAITLPSLTGNINERTWNTQRKALYARFSQAIALMPALNGYGTLKEESSAGASDAEDTAAETFITAGLSKVLKINNICDSDHLHDCGIPGKITAIDATNVISSIPKTLVEYNSLFSGSWSFLGVNYSYSQIDTKAAAFETANGESIITFYNPNCKGELDESIIAYTQSKMCANFIYDLNGSKGPNTMGKDIGFITVLYPSDSVVVAPIPLVWDAASAVSQYDAGKMCKEMDSESRVPNREEAAAMFYNRMLLNLNDNLYWSSSVISSTEGWGYSYGTGMWGNKNRSDSRLVRCIKR